MESEINTISGTYTEHSWTSISKTIFNLCLIICSNKHCKPDKNMNLTTGAETRRM